MRVLRGRRSSTAADDRRPDAARCLALVALALAGLAGPAWAAEPRRGTALEHELAAHAVTLGEAMRAAARPEPRTRAEAESQAAELARRGYTRFPDASLRELLALRGRLAEAPHPRFCAATWTGAYRREMLPVLVLMLTPDQQRRWVQISVAAQLAELRNQPARRSPPASSELVPRLEALLSRSGPGDGPFLARALEMPLALSEPEQCRASRLFYRGLTRLPPQDAAVIFRASLYD